MVIDIIKLNIIMSITMSKLTSDQINSIIEKYKNGETPKSIGNEFGIKNNSVTRILRKNKIIRNQLIKVSDDIKKEIIELYNNNISSEVIAKKFGINGTTVCRILKRNGIKIKDNVECHRKHQINTRYFQSIDCEEKAYILGIMYADGNVSKSTSTCKITLHNQDVDILQKISNIIYGFENLSHVTVKLNNKEITYSTIYITSKNIKTDLINLGCIPNKTLAITFPDDLKVPEHLKNHFIRGYLDGDGSISKLPQCWVNFSGNQKFINMLALYINSKLNLNLKIRNKYNTKNYMFDILSYKSVISFLDYIYTDSTIYMDRKYNRYLKLKEYYIKNHIKYVKLTENVVSDIVSMRKQGISRKEIMDKYGISKTNLTKVLGDNGLLNKKIKINIGDKFNFLIVKDNSLVINGRIKYKCVCNCGNESYITADKLISGHTKSCGCLKKKLNEDVLK